jgi:malate:Na+ symporter
LPYSLAMAEILAEPQAKFIPQLIPAAMLGNLVAIIMSGCMKRFGEKYPQYSGGGLLVKTDEAALSSAPAGHDQPVEFPLMGAGLLLSCTLFIFGGLAGKWIGLPGPVVMIFSAAIIKCSRLLPERIERGAYHIYRFIAANLTWPLLVGLGVLFVPWREVVDAVTPGYAVVCLSAVVAMWTAGFFVGKWLQMYPVEAAMVTGCHTGLGGTGDVAILSAGGRIGLMPFAQAATRIGGALMIVLASLLLKFWR